MNIAAIASTFLYKAAQEAPAEGSSIAVLLTQIFPFIILVAVFYFFNIRPQRKRDKETKQMLAELKVGDNVTTIGGICGKITAIRDDILTLEVGSDKVKLVFERWAIRSVDKPISD